MGSSIGKQNNTYDISFMIKEKEEPISYKKENKLQRAKLITEETIREKISLEFSIDNFNITSDDLNEILAQKDIKFSKPINQEDQRSISLKRVKTIYYEIESSKNSDSDSFFSSDINSEIPTNKKNPINKKSTFERSIYDESLKIKNFYEELKEKLMKSAQLENFPKSKLIHLKELMIPFPEENDLDKITDDNYLHSCIEEINSKFNGKYYIDKFHVDTASKENVNKYMSFNELENEHENELYFNSGDNIYIGINIKLLNNETYVIYYLYALKNN
jgi:hypothetical protein